MCFFFTISESSGCYCHIFSFCFGGVSHVFLLKIFFNTGSDLGRCRMECTQPLDDTFRGGHGKPAGLLWECEWLSVAA